MQIWGNAPFIDGNFRAWMAGQFRGYKKPTEVNQVSADTCKIILAFGVFGILTIG